MFSLPRPSRVAAQLAGVGLCGLLSMATACSKSEPAAPAAAPAAAGNSSLFDNSKKPLPGPPPDDGGGPPQGGPASAPSLSAPVLDPAKEAQCKALKDQEKVLRDQAQKIQEEKVAPVAAEAEAAGDAFEACQEDFACVNNVETYQAKSARAQAAQSRLEAAEGEVAVVEGQLHTLSEQITATCGDF